MGARRRKRFSFKRLHSKFREISEKYQRIWPILKGYVDIRLSIVYMLTDEVIY